MKALKKEDKLLQEWKNKFPARTVAELIQEAHDVAYPGIAYYRKQYREEGGDLYRLRLLAEACQIFDPFKLCSFSVERLNLLADKLSHFEYRQFTSEFIEGLKKKFHRQLYTRNRLLTGTVLRRQSSTKHECLA